MIVLQNRQIISLKTKGFSPVFDDFCQFGDPDFEAFYLTFDAVSVDHFPGENFYSADGI
jgi:hypothetical protein